MALRLSTLAAVVASFGLSALAMPTSPHAIATNLLPRGAEGEPYMCPDPTGTAAAKQKLLAAGATSIDMAIAMLENGCAFTAAYPAGNGKDPDAAELGVYRNNWHMLRTYCDLFAGAGVGDWFSLGQQVQQVIPDSSSLLGQG
ncbi:MAG: hypothetical protein Q9173_002820 [Seirophora scorigena]